MFTAILFTIAKTWKQPRCPSTDGWIKYQLLHHLHLHTALGRAPVVQGVFCVEVSSGGEEGADKRKLALVALPSPPSPPLL